MSVPLLYLLFMLIFPTNLTYFHCHIFDMSMSELFSRRHDFMVVHVGILLFLNIATVVNIFHTFFLHLITLLTKL